MKNLIFILLMLPFFATGQSGTQNFIKVSTYKDSTLTSDATKATAEVTYYDGLGRPAQKIMGKMGGNGRDVIVHIEYDSISRKALGYLPYEATTTNLAYDAAALTNVHTLYMSQAFENTPNPYTEAFYEKSPLNRVLKQAAPGSIWKGNEHDNNDRTTKYSYQTNRANEVQRLRATATWNPDTKLYDIAITDTGFYGAGLLYKTITKGENRTGNVDTSLSWNAGQTIEFKDKNGRVILNKSGVSSSDNFGMPLQGTLNMHYVYDQFGNLTYVLPSSSLTADLTADNIDKYGYQYKYDAKNRLVEKKLPGRDWEYIVYDNCDRPAAVGPAYSPFGSAGNIIKGWLISKFDALGRLAYTGWVEQASFSSSVRNTIQSSAFATVTKTTAAVVIDNVQVYYTNVSFPTSGLKLLTVNYYDNYTFPGVAPVPSGGIEGQVAISNVKGLPTGTWKRILTTASATSSEISTTHYDRKSRPISIITNNSMLGGYTQIDSKLDFDGTILYAITRHKRTNSSSEPVLTTREDFTYNSQERLLSATHTIGNLAPELMTYNSYNSMGQLTLKKVGGTITSPLQHVNLSYNIRGWLKGINDVGALANGSFNAPQDLFAFKINYTDPSQFSTVNPNYNGNITETSWRTSTDNIMRRYSYSYDEFNRLTTAYYQMPGAAEPMRNSYDETLKYDILGNITKLERNGGLDNDTNVITIDNLTYTYNGNRLDKIVDNSSSPQGFADNTLTSVNDFAYDGFGNLISDLNKGINNSIVYNHLNLPVSISTSGLQAGTFSYLYTADGIKLRKTMTSGRASTQRITDYLGGFQYTNSVLDFFPTSEGYVKNTVVNGSNTYKYVYQYKDHLGNIRLSYTIDPLDNKVKIMEENHYYPYGLKHQGYSSEQLLITPGTTPGTVTPYPFPVTLTPVINPSDVSYMYKFNGKELQDELGLNWYDYQARNYDPAIGRWFNNDPLAENTSHFSPYTYCNNNPVIFTDPMGMAAVGPDGLTNEQWVNVSSPGGGNNPELAKMYKASNNSEIGKLNREVEEAYGSHSDDMVNGSESTVYSVIAKIPTLRGEMSRLLKKGKFLIKYNERSTNKGNNAEAITSDKEMDKDGDSVLESKNVRPYIIFYNSSFASYRYLANTILHEFGHIESIYSGFYHDNVDFFLTQGIDGRTAIKYAVAADEVFAYNWAFQKGGLHPYVAMGYDATKFDRNVEYSVNHSYNNAKTLVKSFATMYFWKFNDFYNKSL